MSIITEMTLEYIEKKGCLTAEFQADRLTRKMILEMTECDKMLKDAHWIAHSCKTCASWNDGKPTLHVEILKNGENFDACIYE